METKNNDKVLLIAPAFFGYYKEMVKELALLGFDADYICDMPGSSNLLKAVGRINKKLTYGAAEKYFHNEVLPKITGKKYDYVLLVAGMTFAFSPEMFGKIKELQNSARFIMYQWDSEKNLPYSTHIHQYFDRVFSFDRPDCLREEERYTFLPLFYLREYSQIASDCSDSGREHFTYDCSYVGTAHPKKFKDINEISCSLRSIFPRQFIYHYMPSKLKYYYHKATASEYRNAKLSDFKTEKISQKQILELINNSFCVLDAPQGGQTGLTIRTIECLGAGKKLITTNPDIVYYDFYDPCNVLFWDGSEPDPALPFFTEPYKPLPNEIYEKYSLSSWLKTMLNS